MSPPRMVLRARPGRRVDVGTTAHPTHVMHASPTRSVALSAQASEATGRIERWLLQSPIQLENGPQRGGVGGWLDRDGRPEFVYLEIAGYYLTAMTWLASGAASSTDHAVAAAQRGGLALRWVTDAVSGEAPPPTRLYLSDRRPDWRNSGVFSFDLAMAARGALAARNIVRFPARRQLTARLARMIDGISRDAAVMQSHGVVGADAPIPDRWSTRPGPHHLKAAAALLELDRTPGSTLRPLCQRTCQHWTATMLAGWPCAEIHTLLYGLEGMLIRARTAGPDDLAIVERLYARLMLLQAPDGTLPESTLGGPVRSDVLAQALRAGLMLRGCGFLQGSEWAGRLDALGQALLGYVQPNGGVRFSHEQDITNAWCAMFAHQALLLLSRGATRPPLTAAAFQLLV